MSSWRKRRQAVTQVNRAKKREEYLKKGQKNASRGTIFGDVKSGGIFREEGRTGSTAGRENRMKSRTRKAQVLEDLESSGKRSAGPYVKR